MPMILGQSYTKAAQAEIVRILQEIQLTEEAALRGDARPKPHFVPCPESVGNDPCDDADPYRPDEDW